MPPKIRTNLRAIRQKKKMTVRHLMEMANLSRQSLHTLETKGLDRINAITITQLTKALDCTLSDLIYIVEEE